MPKAVCIIPARGGSKRIPRKNLKSFLGKPIMAYSIQKALDCGLFSEVYVSSEDKEILEIAVTYGAKPLLRPLEISDDYATTQAVMCNAIQSLNLKEEWVCCLYATAPLLRLESLQEAFRMRQDSCYVFGAVEYDYSPFRAFKILENKNAMLFPQYFTKRSQDLEKIYHDAGQFYLAKAKIWQRRENIFEDSISLVLPALEVQDIDNLEDWQIAEMKYQILKNKGIL